MLKILTPQNASFGRFRFLHTSVSRFSKEASKATVAEKSVKKWTPDSLRTGVIARKRGMTTLWDEHGAQYPVTILQVC